MADNASYRHPLLSWEHMPEIDVPLAGGGRWRLSENAPAFMLVIDLYRGMFCPRCRKHFEAMQARRDEFDEVGLEVLALSTDSLENVRRGMEGDWSFLTSPLGYALPVATARALGVFLSRGRTGHEPEIFSEPAAFFVRPDLTLLGAVYSSFAPVRPSAQDMLEVARTVHRRGDGYKPRGDLILD